MSDEVDLKQAIKILGEDVKPDGDVYDLGTYINYTKGFSSATLDGEFGAEYLEALATYMKHYND